MFAESLKQLFVQKLFSLKKKTLMVMGFFCLGFLGMGLWLHINSGAHKTGSICSDLVIPAKSGFLDRPRLMAEIKEKFIKDKGAKTIPIIAIVGMGGVGKTTLARQFVCSYQASIVWEINAETQASLMNSFKDLAYVLAKTEEQKNELNFIRSIKNQEEKEKRLLIFIKSRLRECKNWLLIYDNVESLLEIQNYLPKDSKVWGMGKAIITTRNSNIKNLDYIRPENVIRVGELTEEEGLKLFSKIVSDIDSRQLQQDQKERTRNFLKNIPPFPLDVSVAAHYIKSAPITYEQYLKLINEYSQNSEGTQENLLREMGDYSQTRYNVITLSLKKLIDTHKDFEGLLLLMSLLGSQNIPQDLLGAYKDNAVVESFIHHLKKYSLITSESSVPDSIPVISVHRNTQEISLIYLNRTLNIENNDQIFLSIASTLQKYIDDAEEKDDFLRMKLLISHCERLLDHRRFLTGASAGIIQGTLGIIYYILRDPIKSQQFLNESLVNLRKYHPKYYAGIAQILIYLGETHIELGNHKRPEELLEQGLLIYKKYFSKNHPKVAWALVSLGFGHKGMGHYEKSRKCLEEALRIYQKHFSENHPDVTWALMQLGDAYNALSDYEKSKDLLERAFSIYVENFPENHMNIAWVSLYLGRVYKKIGQYEKSQEFLERALVVVKNCLPENNPEVAWFIGNLGSLYRELGQYESARKLLERALVIYENCLPENSPDTAWILGHLGKFYGEVGQYEKSKEFLEKALRMSQKCLPENKLNMAWFMTLLGNVYREVGQYKEAQKLLQQSLSIYKQYLPKDHVYIGLVLSYLGELYRDLGVCKKAKEFFEQSLVIFEKHYGKDHIKTARILNSLGRACFLENQIERAEVLLLTALKVFQSHKLSESFVILESLSDLYLKKSLQARAKGEMQQSQSFKEKSINYLKEALEITKTHFPKDSTYLTRVQHKLTFSLQAADG